ncbi:MAG: hypothetical protein ACR2QJ_14540 [Geminicoccaceae bacterium]
MSYFRDHWQGRHTFAWAFWINFAAPFVLIAMLEPWIRPVAVGGAIAQTALAAIFVLFVLPWQLVGLWRSSRRYLEMRGEIAIVTLVQVISLVALVVAIIATVVIAQRIVTVATDDDEDGAEASSRYALTVLIEDEAAVRSDAAAGRKGRAILIDGLFDPGLTRELKALLAESADIDAIVLNSDGGHIFEARGVAKQILDNGFDTYVFERCRSACTIAFIAGSKRMLGKGAQLGFHSYRLDGAAAFIDPVAEQSKDRSFFTRQGVQPDFIARAFETPHEEMWHPDADALLGSGVVNKVVESR